MKNKRINKKPNRLFLLFLAFPILLPLISTAYIFKADKNPAKSNIKLISPTPLPINHSGVVAKVIRVIDGDTIEIATAETVRYIGINTPELKDNRGEVQCFSNEATEKNRELVEGKSVELEKDISETDVYGRLLRYVWIGDRLINEELVSDGYAHSATFPPDIKYQTRFIEAARMAQSENKGFWGVGCTEF